VLWKYKLNTMDQKQPIERKDYKYFYPISTRWMDNDVYGHINNVTYYSYFDSAVNNYLIENTDLDIINSKIVGYVVNSSCNYLSSLSFPDEIETGLRVNKIGNSSVTYGIGVFKKGEDKVSAYGEFTHVFVNRSINKSTPIPIKTREALEKLLII
jgi:acyl-CoA thioester hydrolase